MASSNKPSQIPSLGFTCVEIKFCPSCLDASDNLTQRLISTQLGLTVMKGSNSMKYSCDTRSSKLDESGVPVTAQRLIFASSTAISGPPVLHLWQSTSVSGVVQVDATIQHERSVKF